MTCQHTAKHHEIRAAAEGFRDISRTRTAAVTDDATTKTVRSIRTFDNRGQLWVTDTGFYACRTHRAWANAYFNNVGTREDKLFYHIACYDVTRRNHFVRKCSAHSLHVLDKVLRIAVRDIDTDEDQFIRQCHHIFGFLEICFRCAG
ncbi:Uncharacterised protein [Vibrio cholerae]|uniref:Uncharacterized protein n=1 Tax=Vibrio cholerae TaxID=666 RepID=A0A655TQ88_VIBCL|nr:Uncharacterised protein [Vibrio cholerae]CRZ55986.1 Uncharacterised protein [Vibrio cholerae]CSA00379.1 Uncharacterised protein [Vibrio cholerae]CSA05894.1 Uncharacterised protein [Vibrio cholerae]CSA18211.1 Uncharacterised protein [Vibrio cholerae]